MAKTRRVYLDLDAGIIQELKVKCVTEGVSMKKRVEELITASFETKPKPKAKAKGKK